MRENNHSQNNKKHIWIKEYSMCEWKHRYQKSKTTVTKDASKQRWQKIAAAIEEIFILLQNISLLANQTKPILPNYILL